MAFDWKKTIASVAPTLATALGGPLAGAAVSAISTAILGKQDGSSDEIAAAVASASPDLLLKLKQADQDFAKSMATLGVDLERISAADRDSARKREVGAHDSWTPRFLAGAIVGGFLCMVWYVLSGQVSALKDPTVAGLIGTLIGYVSAKADQVVAYYFGSSASSARKDTMLLQATPPNKS